MAVTRPNIRFVPTKTDEQQVVLSLHRVRQGFVKARTAQANQIRGLLSEFGEIIPQGIAHIAKSLPEIMEKQDLPGTFRDPAQKVVSLVIALALYRRKLVKEIVDNLDSALPDAADRCITSSATTQARQRVGADPLR